MASSGHAMNQEAHERIFLKMPIELRKEIWESATHKPREMSLMRRTGTSACFQPAIMPTSREPRPDRMRRRESSGYAFFLWSST